jgi:hypothetical protein
VRTCNHDGLAGTQEVFIKNIGEGAKRDALVKNVFEFGIAARNGIAHYDDIRPGLEIGLSIGLGYRNTDGSQKIRHRRIGGCVGTGNFESALLQQASE